MLRLDFDGGSSDPSALNHLVQPIGFTGFASESEDDESSSHCSEMPLKMPAELSLKSRSLHLPSQTDDAPG